VCPSPFDRSTLYRQLLDLVCWIGQFSWNTCYRFSPEFQLMVQIYKPKAVEFSLDAKGIFKVDDIYSGIK
jgi:hypothetical protein